MHTPVSPAVASMVHAMPKDRGKPVVVVAGSDYAQRCDYRPCLSERDARERALHEGVVIYGIVNRTKEPPTQVGAFPVAKMSAATGGGYLFLTGKEPLGPLMAQVTEELRHEYLLGFTPPVADGREHSVTGGGRQTRPPRDGPRRSEGAPMMRFAASLLAGAIAVATGFASPGLA